MNTAILEGRWRVLRGRCASGNAALRAPAAAPAANHGSRLVCRWRRIGKGHLACEWRYGRAHDPPWVDR